MSHDDFAFEPIPGLPGRPPKGETILWQGRPRPMTLAREALALRWVAGYFALLSLWRFAASLADMGLGMAALTALPLIALGAVACLILYAIAWVQARSARYTITTERVALKTGAALQVTFNVPFAQIEAARLDTLADGTGTLALKTGGDDRISYLIAWPHVRPWRTRDPEPALRAIPEAEKVGRILSEALQARADRPDIVRVAAEPMPTARDPMPERPAVAAE